MKKTSTLILLALFAIQVSAQVTGTDVLEKDLKKKTDVTAEGLTKSGILNIGLNEGMLENWAAGGERYSLAVNSVFNGYTTNLKGNKLFENTLDLYYGLNYVASANFVPRKIDDRIDFSSRYGVKPNSWANKNILKHTYLMGLARLQSQFTKGYNYSDPAWQSINGGNGISNFLSPLYTTLALGAEYRPNDQFNVFMSPLAARMIYADKVYTSLKPDGAFGVAFNESSAFELGAYLSARYNTHLTKTIDYRTRIDLYANYLDSPQNVDLLWDNFFAFKISKFIGGGLGFTMLYDNDVPGQYTKDSNGDGTPDTLGPLGWVQLKQVLNLGFSYKF